MSLYLFNYRLKDLNQRCGKQVDAYAACLDYNGCACLFGFCQRCSSLFMNFSRFLTTVAWLLARNALINCRKAQEAMQKACPV